MSSTDSASVSTSMYKGVEEEEGVAHVEYPSMAGEEVLHVPVGDMGIVDGMRNLDPPEMEGDEGEQSRERGA